MSKNLSLLVVALLIVPVILTACGGDDKKDNKESKTVSLDQTFTSENYGLTLRYPDGWTARDGDYAIEIGNKQEAINVMNAGADAVIPADSFGLQIAAVPLAKIGMAGQPIANVLKGTALSMNSEDTKAGEVRELQIGGKEAARVDITNTKQKADGFAIGFMLDDNIVIMIVGVASQGDLGKYEETATQIAATIAAAPAS
jgi:hypothetical protein